MDIQKISLELVRAVRGTKTQTALNQKLGFKGNQLYRWESGEREVRWPDFVNLCRICNVDIESALERFFSYSKDASRSDLLTTVLIGEAKLLEVSAKTAISHYSLVRWRKNKATPTLPDTLSLIHHCQFVLLEFLDQLVGINNIPSAQNEFETRAFQKKIFHRYPIVSALLCFLQLDSYKALSRHDEGLIARMLGIPLEEERDIISALEKIDVIRMIDGKYKVLSEHFDLKSDFSDMRALRIYWLERVLQFYQNASEPPNNTGCGVDIHAASTTAIKQIRDEALSFFLKVRSILQSDSGEKDQIYVLNLQMYDIFEAARSIPVKAK